jgi:hypothetical protein
MKFYLSVILNQLLMVLVVYLLGCASLPCHCAETTTSDEWIQLFNGRDLEGWTPKVRGHAAGENFGDTFRVEDGILKVSYDQYQGPFQERFGHLFYDQPCSHYVLRLEYRFVGEQVPGGPGWAVRNSGIMIHGQTPESMEQDQDFPASIEVQLLGGDGKHSRHTGNLCTPGTHVIMGGKLIKRHCTSSSSPTYHGNRWVSVQVEVHGNGKIRHFVEGQLVLEYEQSQLDESDPSAQRLLKQGQSKRLSGGTISLQSESHPVEFRKIELRQLKEPTH